MDESIETDGVQIKPARELFITLVFLLQVMLFLQKWR